MPLLVSLAALTPEAVPSRMWLERLAFVVPGGEVTRWLLVGDVVCLVALGSLTRWPMLGIPAALGAGFLALNLVSMTVTDFYLGLALFHLAVGITTAAVVRAAPWASLAWVALTLLLGVVT